MKKILGKEVFDSLQEIIDPKHTALLIIDMQNHGLASDGATARAGRSISAKTVILPATKSLLEAARNRGVRIFFTKIVETPESIHSAWFYRVTKPLPDSTAPKIGTPKEGSRDAEIVSDLAPKSGEVVISKYRSSAFLNTDLDVLLRRNGIQSLVIAGVSTELCVLATVIDAQSRNYYIALVRDCVGSLDPERAKMANVLMEKWVEMPTSDAIISIWTKRP